MKRFIRDHIRYIDLIQCAAARVVHALRERARARGDPDGNFDSFHIRRGDFDEWASETQVDASQLYNISQADLVENATLYIATDEQDRSFFDPLKQHYDIVFLDDFMDHIAGVDANFYGMIEQLVTSRSRSFFGCYWSTFSGYINRLRGYHANNAKEPGYESGVVRSWYYAPAKHRDDMRVFFPVYQYYYSREFPTSWRLIDKGIDEPQEIISQVG